MTIALQTRSLGKKYKIGVQQAKGYRTLRDAIMQSFQRKHATIKDGEFWALQDINLDIQQGERVGIIGRNGAGKSTLLKLISRIAHPTTGEIRINGRVSSLLEVGTGFHPELTGRENIYLNGAILGMSHAEIKKNFDAIVDFAGVERFLDTPVKRYSSGMYMRLAFAVAAHLESEILIVDEVLAVGDSAFQKKCLGKMEEMGKRDGRTVLFVSHDMNVISTFCQRVILLEQGQCKVDSNDPVHTIKNYLHNEANASLFWQRDDANKAKTDNVYCQPEAFYLANGEGHPLAMPIIANNQETYVYLKFNIEEIDPALTLGYAIYTDAGELLYWSYQTDQAEAAWPPVQKGDNVLRSLLPMRLLNEGAYRLEFLASLHFRQWLLEPNKNAPSIHFEIQGGLSDSPIWINRRPGLLAPALIWEKQA